MSGPHDPEEWLQRARSNLTRARHRIQGVFCTVQVVEVVGWVEALLKTNPGRIE